MLRILGQPEGAPSNFPAFLNCVHPEDRGKILEADRKVRSSSIAVDVEYRIIRPQGELRFVRSSSSTPIDVEYRVIRPEGEVRFVRSIVEAIRNNQGAVVRIAGASQDISEQVKARELLRESEERFKRAERLAHVGNWHWDLKSNQVIWSEECFRIFDLPRDPTPTYEDFHEAVITQDRGRVARWVRDCIAEKSGHSIEFQIARGNGDLRTVTCTSEVSLDEEGAAAGIFGASQDITHLKRA